MRVLYVIAFAIRFIMTSVLWVISSISLIGALWIDALSLNLNTANFDNSIPPAQQRLPQPAWQPFTLSHIDSKISEQNYFITTYFSDSNLSGCCVKIVTYLLVACSWSTIGKQNRVNLQMTCHLSGNSKLTYPPPPPPCVAYMRQWIGSALVQITACHLLGAKPLSKPVLIYCPVDFWEQTSVRSWYENNTFHSGNCLWKYRMRDDGHFVQGKCVNSISLHCTTYEMSSSLMPNAQVNPFQ